MINSRYNIRLNLLCTADWYQGFIPLFAYCWTKTYPEYPVDIGVMGELDDSTKSILKNMNMVQVRKLFGDYINSDGVIITENVWSDIPILISTANTLRFLLTRNAILSNGYFITDIDFLYFSSGEDIIQWHTKKMKEFGSCYYAHHGPWKRPNRFPGQSWHGEFERLAGGAVYLSGEWMEKTKYIREKYRNQLEQGVIGTYRESDEVTLCRICKEAGFPINQDKNYPAEFRCIHLGDFRPDMNHRWKNMEKMRRILTDGNCRRYIEMTSNDDNWNDILFDICSNNEKIELIFKNLNQHLINRGFDKLYKTVF